MTRFLNLTAFRIALVLAACLMLTGATAFVNNPADGRFVVIPAGVGLGSVTTFSCVTANGVSCTVANPTSTPAATFTLGAITPSTVNKITLIAPATAGTIAFGADNSTAMLPNGTVTKTVFSGSKALATSAISSASCTSAQTVTATGTLTTDTVIATFNGDPTGLTGFLPVTTGALTIFVYPTADTINIKECNMTSGSITPSAVTLNLTVVR